MKNTKPNTKAQERREAYLERRGYDFSHHTSAGLPVLILRSKGIAVQINRDGSYQPAQP